MRERRRITQWDPGMLPSNSFAGHGAACFTRRSSQPAFVLQRVAGFTMISSVSTQAQDIPGLLCPAECDTSGLHPESGTISVSFQPVQTIAGVVSRK